MGTTGAWTAGAAEEVKKSPDNKSRASPVPMVGCRRRETMREERKYQYPAVLILFLMF